MNNLKSKLKITPIGIIRYIILIIFGLIIFYPLSISVVSSLRSQADLFSNPLGLPEKLIFTNFYAAWVNGSLHDYFINSVYVTAFSVVLQLILASFLAFSICRKDSILRKFIYPMIIIGMAIPYQSGVFPLYMNLSNLGLISTHIGLILTFSAYWMGISSFVLYGFFRQLPDELIEAAIVDGCNNFKIYSLVIMPLSLSALTTVSIINITQFWNNFFFPLVLLSSRKLYTLPLGLLGLQGEYMTQFPVLFAGVIIVSIPIIIIFIFFQRYFVEGITSGAIK